MTSARQIGRPKVAGTGVTVMRIAAWYKTATQYGHLSLAQVRAAPAYYHANPEEVEADLAHEEASADSVERAPGSFSHSSSANLSASNSGVCCTF